jgi:hypothetical protein
MDAAASWSKFAACWEDSLSAEPMEMKLPEAERWG